MGHLCLGFLSRIAAAAVLACAVGGWGHSGAAAATFEQIQAGCRAEAAPQVQACIMGRGGRNPQVVAECRESAGATVRACIQRETKKAAAGKAAPPPPTPETARGSAGAALSVPVAGFVAPPRSIADITAVLDNEKPDPGRIARARRAADAEPPARGTPEEIAQFYYERGNARSLLARNREALADGLKALEQNGLEYRHLTRIRQFVAGQYTALGEPKQALAMYQRMVSEGNAPGSRGTIINASRSAAQVLVSIGDVTQADAYARRVAALVQEARGSPHPNWRNAYVVYGTAWESDADAMRGMVFEARGQYREAETAYKRAEAFRRAALKTLKDYDFPPPPQQVIVTADNELLAAARSKAKQGRLSEAEADMRRALLSVLNHQGKYHVQTPKFVLGLGSVLVEQGRYQDAEKLTRAALEIQRSLGIGDESPTSASILSQLGSVLILQRQPEEAAAVYAELDKALAKWEPNRRLVFELNGSRISALYASGQLEAGIAAAGAALKRELARVGEKHFDTAAARGILAVGLARAGKSAEALREFRAALPVLMAATGESAEDEDPTVVAARSQRLQTIVEAYIHVAAAEPKRAGADVGAETFRLADAIRGRSVQRALTASSARMVAKDPALAELVREEQDLAKQVNAQLGLLNNTLALPSGERNPATVRAINASIEKLRTDRAKIRADIGRRFPSYADLIDPKAPGVEEIRTALKPGEALLSFYFGADASFVWAVPKTGPVAFAEVAATAQQLEAKIRRLRDALEPNAETIGDIPPFDLELAYEIYAQLLKPVEAGWKSAKDLVVVTNGALGLLPLSLLPTAPAEASEGDVIFAAYRTVPWLARTHAVTMVPSAAALRTLRSLPPGSPQRDNLIAFGDPYFNEQQAAETEPVETVEVAALTRGIRLNRRSSPQTAGVNSAELGLLPRLPDTADELKSIALALEADPSRVVHLGKSANERQVKTTDLSKFKIIAFATHGLVPGDLNGLVQPALALSAPSVAAVEGDGLLTMEEILALKLDADWVVLSACNTGAGAGAGAEAASGLGRAFFYAGTRAILVTNWSVHSASARELVSDLFRRQSIDPTMSRGEALRQAMVALMDGAGWTDDGGKTLFAYAHPLFWAPYSIIGDGGGAH